MNASLQLLKDNQIFRTYWSARSISVFGDAIAQIALVLYVFHRFHGGSAIGGLLFAQVIPRLLGPVTGALADRVEQKWLIVACDIVQAVLFTVISFGHVPFAALIILVALCTVVSTMFMPAGKSALATIAEREELITANVFLQSSANVCRMLGPVVSGLIVSRFGTESALTMDAVSFVFSAFLMMRLPRLRPAVRTKGKFGEDMKAGLKYISGNRTVRALTLVMFIYVAFAAVDNVAMVFLAHNVLNAGDQGYAWLSTAYGLGLLIGSGCLVLIQKKVPAKRLLWWGIGLFGMGTLMTGLSNSLWMAIAFQMIASLGNSFENVATDTVVQQSVPVEMLGRVFGTLYSSMEGASSLAFAMGGPLLGWMSAGSVFVLSGTLVLLSLLLFTQRDLRGKIHSGFVRELDS